MTRSEATLYLSTVLTTLAEMNRHEAPEGHLYMALQHAGCTLDDFYGIKHIMCETEPPLATAEPGPQLRLTAEGLALAAKINAALSKKEA